MGTPQGGVISPLLVNIVLDKELAKQGYAFVRGSPELVEGYADDFLVLTKSATEIEKALELVKDVIEVKLSLKLSPEKTKVSTFNGGGFDFLGFHFSRTDVSMRDKSVENLKDKIRTLTTRSHNFSDEVIQKINRVTRGSATDFSNVQTQFVRIDHMIRRRLRCMKKKRISASNNYRIPNRFFKRKGLVSLYELT